MHHRRSIRIQWYDYSQSWMYFITICTQWRSHLFGNIENGRMILNDAGSMIEHCWKELPDRFPGIQSDIYVIMPNHLHAIVEIRRGDPCGRPVLETWIMNDDPCGRPVLETWIMKNNSILEKGQPQGLPLPGKAIGDIVGAFKSISTHEYLQWIQSWKFPPFEKRLWQRNYWEHIIRTEKSYFQIQEYIENNPQNWESDTLY